MSPHRVRGTRVLIDCGLYQGGHELDEENPQGFGFDPAGIDFVLLTHAHLDHCGRLPLLVKRGFRGAIVTTGASRDLLRLVLLDAAHVHQEALRRARHAGRRGACSGAGADGQLGGCADTPPVVRDRRRYACQEPG